MNDPERKNDTKAKIYIKKDIHTLFLFPQSFQQISINTLSTIHKQKTNCIKSINLIKELSHIISSAKLVNHKWLNQKRKNQK
jgi:hypothetical protein